MGAMEIKEAWEIWQEISSGLPPQVQKSAEAYIKHQCKELPVCETRFESLGPTEKLEKLIIGNVGTANIAKRILYVAWRLGEGYVLGNGHLKANFQLGNPSRLIECCTSIGYTLEEVIDDAAYGMEQLFDTADNYTTVQDDFERYGYRWRALMRTAGHKYFNKRIAHLDYVLLGDGRSALLAEKGNAHLLINAYLVMYLCDVYDPRRELYIKALMDCCRQLQSKRMNVMMMYLAEKDEITLKYIKSFPLKQIVEIIDDSIRWEKLVKELAQKRPQEALEIIGEFTDAGRLINWLKFLYNVVGIQDFSPLIGLLGHRSKSVRNFCEKMLMANLEQVHDLIVAAYPQRDDSPAGQIVQRLLDDWAERHPELLAQPLFTTQQEMLDYCKQHLLPKDQKLLSWLPEGLFDMVQLADGSTAAPKEVLQLIAARYLSHKYCVRLPIVDQVLPYLNRLDLQRMAQQAYQFWVDEGSIPKRRMLLPLCSVCASQALLLQMYEGAVALAKQKRGEIAEFLIRAIAVNDGSTALMLLESIASSEERRKPRAAFARVETAAKEEFEKAAQRRGISWDALADQVVSNLGFDQNGEYQIDYGARTLTIHLMPDLSMQVVDEKGKQTKSLPKARASDDPAKAEAAKSLFLDLKKQVKAVYNTQSKKLERVLRTGRRWSLADWRRLFLQNPVMRPFVLGLIWGVYAQEKLVATFRYLEDGTLNTAKEEEYTLPEQAELSLVHPIELEESELAAWRQQLEDYEVTPPFAQLNMPAQLAPSDWNKDGWIIRWKGKSTLTSRLQMLVTRYGALQEPEELFLFDREIGAGLLLVTETVYWDYHGAIKLYAARFVDSQKEACDPAKLPPRFVSSLVGLIDRQILEGVPED